MADHAALRARRAARVTDPDVLGLYADRLLHDLVDRVANVGPVGVVVLEAAAIGEPFDQEYAQMRLTELGEAARPLRDEGVPCG